MKTGKQIKVDTMKNHNITYGCVDNKNPKSVFINITSWLEPLCEDIDDYDSVIKVMDKKIRQTVYNYLSTNNTIFIKDKSIIDLDLRESGIKIGKKSFMSCEITLFQNGELPLNSELMKSNLNNISHFVIEKILNEDDTFRYHKKK